MAAVKKLLVDRLVTNPAVCRRYTIVNNKSVMIRSFLALCDLVTIQAIKPFFRVSTHLKLMDHGVLGIQMAFRAFATGPDKGGTRLFNDRSRPSRIDEVSRQNQCCRDGNRDEYSAEIHDSIY